jgi:hypothetical protein
MCDLEQWHEDQTETKAALRAEIDKTIGIFYRVMDGACTVGEILEGLKTAHRLTQTQAEDALLEWSEHQVPAGQKSLTEKTSAAFRT